MGKSEVLFMNKWFLSASIILALVFDVLVMIIGLHYLILFFVFMGILFLAMKLTL